MTEFRCVCYVRLCLHSPSVDIIVEVVARYVIIIIAIMSILIHAYSCDSLQYRLLCLRSAINYCRVLSKTVTISFIITAKM